MIINKKRERMMKMERMSRELKIARREGIKVSEVRIEEDHINTLMERLYNHAQRVKGITSLASKAKLREEISAVECCFAFYWKKYDKDFMRKLDECKRIQQEMRVPENHWYTFKKYSA